jgi:DNA-binding response OmpR family regulator
MTILIVEDEAMIALDLTNAFEGMGLPVACFGTASEAHLWLDENSATAAVLDFKLRDGDCRFLVQRLKELGVHIILHTVYTRDDMDLDEELTDIPVVLKPDDSSAVVDLVKQLLRS